MLYSASHYHLQDETTTHGVSPRAPPLRVQSLSELTVQELFKDHYSGIGYHL
jgi:hypothetical protein